MKLSVCSYSFHKMLSSGEQDMFAYIRACADLGCTQLDPWMAHLAPIHAAAGDWRKMPFPHQSASFLASDEIRYLSEVRRAAERAGLPFGCVAVDGGHMYDTDPAVRNANRAIAYRWIDVCAVLGAGQIRLDCGGSEQMSEGEFKLICEGYLDVIGRAAERGVEVVIENHWGPSKFPKQLIRILEATPGLGLLWDSYNFAAGHRDEGREECARFARITHMKAFRFAADGTEPDEDIRHAVGCLKKVAYAGTWGIESCPVEMGEYEAVEKTIALVRREAAGG